MRTRGDGRVFRRGARWWVQFNAHGQQHREPARIFDNALGLTRPAKTEGEAVRALRARRREVDGGRFLGPQVERLTVAELLDALEMHQENKGIRSLAKTRSHLKAVRTFFGTWRALEVTTASVEEYQRQRRALGRAPATINRELESLRRAFSYASKLTPPLFPRHLVPTISALPVDNVRTGYFDAAEVAALLANVPHADLRDFIEWGFRTGMRKGEIAKLEWSMLDRSGPTWVLNLPGSITKNGRGRALGLQGEVRTIIERRLRARRFDCPLIFHRTSKGRAGAPILAFDRTWRNALRAAKLPPSRIFHDLRRSAVRNLIRAGVDPSVAMKISGHRTRSMLDRYNIVGESETAAALALADAYLSAQPKARNIEEGQFGDSRAAVGAEVLAGQRGLAEAGGNRTHRSGVQPGAGRL